MGETKFILLQLQMSIEWTRALAMPISVVVASYIVGVHVDSAAGKLGAGIKDGLSALMTVAQFVKLPNL